MIILGEDRCGLGRAISRGACPCCRPGWRRAPGQPLQGRRLVAFAGIGRPAKFFETLRAAGAEVVETLSFPDHHPYRPDEVEAILAAGATRRRPVRSPRKRMPCVLPEADRAADRGLAGAGGLARLGPPGSANLESVLDG